MQVHSPHSAGLDVHKASAIASLVLPRDDVGNAIYEGKRCTIMPRDLLQLADWLQERGVTRVVLESTGEYGKPIYNLLAYLFTLCVVNPPHAKNVPGRKTDENDAAWLAKLMTYGLLSARFIPPPGHRERREMTRARAGRVKERVHLTNRL
jgi:transposase